MNTETKYKTNQTSRTITQKLQTMNAILFKSFNSSSVLRHEEIIKQEHFVPL